LALHIHAELDRHLLALAGDDWLFDRTLVAGDAVGLTHGEPP
jgi:hypothetical protein